MFRNNRGRWDSARDLVVLFWSPFRDDGKVYGRAVHVHCELIKPSPEVRKPHPAVSAGEDPGEPEF